MLNLQNRVCCSFWFLGILPLSGISLLESERENRECDFGNDRLTPKQTNEPHTIHLQLFHYGNGRQRPADIAQRGSKKKETKKTNPTEHEQEEIVQEGETIAKRKETSFFGKTNNKTREWEWENERKREREREKERERKSCNKEGRACCASLTAAASKPHLRRPPKNQPNKLCN